ncbi:uncharacterized protein BCR38DRAFT_413458 [Pseudomassariella vexata]|uniref:Uncharacterized protein n=1 Tax=Pseudomassariella vexata TaxID=1141098 RepID=A0A1Y2DFH7_9PEZI|nr:uncharacterized protein BCR38DRAFT_413458 [Pseudomassariella vexata]ORY58043.1 hypothetical protein BCR38DRAFT_413458 [Pseudomassariella vexata]
MYSFEQIWTALERGYDIVQGRQPYSGWNGADVPHHFGGHNYALQFTPVGDGDWDNMRLYLLVRGPGPWAGPTRNPGPDCVVFDLRGRYFGVVTHRGEINNEFHWATPTDINARAIRIPGVPGIDNLIGYDKPGYWNNMF